MSIDAITAIDADQAHVDAAHQRLAVVLAEEKPASDATSPVDVERGHAVTGAARVELVEAEAANTADQAKSVPAPQSAHGNEPRGPAHLVELVI